MSRGDLPPPQTCPRRWFEEKKVVGWVRRRRTARAGAPRTQSGERRDNDQLNWSRISGKKTTQLTLYLPMYARYPLGTEQTDKGALVDRRVNGLSVVDDLLVLGNSSRSRADARGVGSADGLGAGGGPVRGDVWRDVSV